MSDDVRKSLNDSAELTATRMEVPSTIELQQKILAETKVMRQESLSLEPIEHEKSNLVTRLDWPLLPLAMTMSLVVALFILMSISENPQPETLETTVVNVSLEGAQTDTDQALLSKVELELYDLLMLQDDLILAQF